MVRLRLALSVAIRRASFAGSCGFFRSFATTACCGSKSLTDTVDINGTSISVGKLVLSPTRTYLPVLKKLLSELKGNIHGLIHCTGGGQTKVSKFVQNKRIIKNNLLPVPPLFQLIQKESGTEWKEMYQVFNMGQRLEVYLDKKYAEEVINIANNFGIDAQICGYVEDAVGEHVRIESPYGVFEY